MWLMQTRNSQITRDLTGPWIFQPWASLRFTALWEPNDFNDIDLSVNDAQIVYQTDIHKIIFLKGFMK